MTGSEVWVRTDPDLDGIYRVVLEVGPDESVGLTTDTATEWARYVIAAAAKADYEAAVIAQFTEIAPGHVDVHGGFVAAMRDGYPPDWPPAPVPLSLTPGVSHRTRKGFLTVELNGEPVGQWSPDDARSHAVGVLDACAVAELDGVYLANLKGQTGLDDATARSMVGALGKYRD